MVIQTLFKESKRKRTIVNRYNKNFFPLTPYPFRLKIYLPPKTVTEPQDCTVSMTNHR